MRYRVLEKLSCDEDFSLYVEDDGTLDWDERKEAYAAARRALTRDETTAVKLMLGERCVVWWEIHGHTDEMETPAEGARSTYIMSRQADSA